MAPALAPSPSPSNHDLTAHAVGSPATPVAAPSAALLALAPPVPALAAARAMPRRGGVQFKSISTSSVTSVRRAKRDFAEVCIILACSALCLYC